MEKVSNKAIQKYILKNVDTLSTGQMAEKLNVEPIRVTANKASLKRQGLIGAADIKKSVDTTINKLDSILDIGKRKKLTAYQLKKIKNENTYTNENGKDKEVAREKMALAIIDSKVVGVIPTLPHKEWKIEQMVANSLKGVKFIGIERDKATYSLMKANLKRINLIAETHFGNFADKLYGQIENAYAHLIMDYCGQLETICKEIEYAILNDLVMVGGVLAITFAKPMRGTTPMATKIKGLASINNTDSRCISERCIDAYFNKLTGFNYQVVETYHYQDNYPMTLVLIKRLK